MNWTVTVFDDRTEFSYSPVGESQNGSETAGHKITAEWLPDGYVLHDYEECKFGTRCLYCSEEGGEFSVSALVIKNSTLTVDTEDAEVSSVEISGKDAMLVKKNHLIQIVWVDEEHQQYVLIDGPESLTEELIVVAQGIAINYT